MAHSLFEPAPEPFGEKLWRRVKALGNPAPSAQPDTPSCYSDPALVRQANHLDARGRQELLETLLATKPIKR
ncbi:hypothetical protein [Roseibium sp.]|uniref:hypothetical protein n=1 Tax=Roseibium sp. TaxID=1936156 RepID=UPI003BB13F48